MTSIRRTKGLIRSLNRSQTATGKATAGERSGVRLREPAACEHCGAVFARRVWRRDVRVTSALLDRIHWVVCPGCELVRQQRGFGRVVVEGDMPSAQEDLVRRRLRNVAIRAASTQPERRLVAIERDGDVLEVITTSQKLAHRIARELAKILGGKPRYAWSDDRTLFATLKLQRKSHLTAREAS